MKHKVKVAINSDSFCRLDVAEPSLLRRPGLGLDTSLVYYFMAKFRRREALKSITGITLRVLSSPATLVCLMPLIT